MAPSALQRGAHPRARLKAHERAGEVALQEAESRLAQLHRRQHFTLSSEGDAQVTPALELALSLQWRLGFPSTPRGVGQLTHGRLHYPAGMQPSAALALLRRAHSPGGTVCDCFCGGGTSLIEALRCGRNAVGSDVSPLAAFVAQLQASPPTDAALREAERSAQHIADAALSSSVEADCNAPSGWGKLLSALRSERSCSTDAQRCLWFAYASALERGSRKKKPRAVELFTQTLRGYVGGARHLREVVGESSNEADASHALISQNEVNCDSEVPWAEVSLADARHFDPGRTIDSLICSVPYPGGVLTLHIASFPAGNSLIPQCSHLYAYAVYKYQSHARWMRSIVSASMPSDLGIHFLDVNVPDGRDWPEEWSSGEVGDRKRAKQKDPDAFAEQWQADQDAWVAQQSQWLAPGGRISVVVGDGKGIDSNASLQTAFKRVGLHTLASATISAQELPRERREPGRRRTEHVLLAEKPVW